MEKIGLKAVLEDADFQKGIKKYQDSLDKATGITSTFATTATKTSKGGITDLWSAFQLVERIGGQVVDVISDIVNETVDYNKTVREMTQVTGLGAEEVSRIVQVSDDWGISINEVRTSLAFMNKTGVTPSIDNLAKLADEYVNTEDKSVFAEKAVKILGRGYQTLIPILAQGGDALRDQAAAVNDSLIATDESIAASRDYEVALDTLQDTVTGLKHELGEGLLPVLIDIVKAMNSVVIATEGNIDLRRITAGLMEKGIITEKRRLALLWAVTSGEISQADALKEVNDMLAGSTAGFVPYTSSIQKTIEVTEEETEVTLILAHALDVDYKRAIYGARDAIKAQYDEMLRMNRATGEAKIAFDTLTLALNDPLAKAIEEFIGKQDELKVKMGEVKGQIDILNGTELLTEDQQTELDDLQSEYDGLKVQYKENADAHNEATKRIIIDIATQQVAASGLSDDIKTKLYEQILSTATAWGLTDTAALTATLAISGYLETEEPTIVGFGATIRGVGDEFGIWSEKMEPARQKASDIALLIENMIGTHEVILDVSVIGDTIPNIPISRKPGEDVPFRAGGGTVRRGSPYVVGEGGIETFVPDSNGVIIPNNMTEAMIAAFRLFSPPTAAMPIGGGGGSIVTINMGGVVIANDMDEQAFIGHVEGAVLRAMGV